MVQSHILLFMAALIGTQSAFAADAAIQHDIRKESGLRSNWYACSVRSDCIKISPGCSPDIGLNKNHEQEAMARINEYCSHHANSIGCPVYSCRANIYKPYTTVDCINGQCVPVD